MPMPEKGLYPELCFGDQPGRRRDQRIFCTGRSHLPLLDAVPKLERAGRLEYFLRAAPPPA